jgi:hypothetical protein
MRASSRHAVIARMAMISALSLAVLSLTSVSSAAAHSNPPNYISAIVGVQPAVQGLDVSVTRDGNWLTIGTGAAHTVVVNGYEHEPYLKITTQGVWQNTLAPATYLNDDMAIGEMPTSVSAVAAPSWHQISTSNSYRFHDHRIDWMGTARPPVVAKDPKHPHLIKNWTIGLRIDGVPVTINGTLSWAPTASTTLDWLFALVCIAIAIAFGVAMAIEDRRKKKAGKPKDRRRDAMDIWSDLHAGQSQDIP